MSALGLSTARWRPAGAPVHWLVLTLVALAPLPFGSNRPWSWSLLATLAGVLLIVWSAGYLRSSRRFAIAPRRIAVPALLYMSACLFALLQTLPVLPEAMAHPLWSLDAGIRPPGGLRPISLSPADTLTALLRLLSYGIVFWLVLQGSRESRRADEVVGVIGIISGLYSAYGVIVFLTGGQTVLWFEKWAYQESVTSTFVNRNSFATYAGLGLLCAVAYLYRALVRVDIDQTSIRRSIGDLLARMTPFVMGSIAAIPLNLAALFLTQSRAGIVFSVLAMIVFVIGLSVRIKARRMAVSLAVLTVIGVGYYFLVSGAGFVERLDRLIGSDLANNARLTVYRATVSGILDFPWLGVGYGTYEEFFRTIRSPDMPSRFIKAHSTYLECIVELGIPAAAMLISSIAILAYRALLGLRRRRSLFVYGWMGFCASVLVGCHALVDFSLQIPAIAVTYAAIIAVGCSQSWSSRTDTSK